MSRSVSSVIPSDLYVISPREQQLHKYIIDNNIDGVKSSVTNHQFDTELLNRALRAACSSKRYEIAHVLLSHGANDYNMGFHECCKNGYTGLACELLDLGANNIITGITQACRFGNVDCLQIIINKIIKVYGQNNMDLHDGIIKGLQVSRNQEILKFLHQLQ